MGHVITFSPWNHHQSLKSINTFPSNLRSEEDNPIRMITPAAADVRCYFTPPPSTSLYSCW